MSVVNNPSDDESLARARAEQEDPWVMYIVVRESLGMTPGKMGAQVGHAVGIIAETFRHMSIDDDWEPLEGEQLVLFENMKAWLDQSFRKVILTADEKEWIKLKEQHDCYLVRDAGLTQVEPGSETVIGLWPMKKSSRSKLLKRLRALG